MLKALELFGFKSFADKTRFDFPDGITVVVGPNGSGKSNIVDGIKWVLGEQSAKSLRGKEMADVIFKGSSGADGRRPAGAAEASLIIDNANRRIDVDADEIRVTRRVYRSGESEYLINGAPSRLKDIRNMFRGTGVGTDAYSLIEQGKVERMLQASPKDRRAIFEEAAGISRFNAKKIEAQRRLARVEQNLVRLADIVEEVGGRYRSIKNQASKAARYREATTRLQELRTHVGATDWRAFTSQLDALEQQKQTRATEVEQQEQQLRQLEQQNRQLETDLAAAREQQQQAQDQLSQLLQHMASRESESQAIQERIAESSEQQQHSRQRLQRIADNFSETTQRLSTLRGEADQSSERFAQAQQSLQELQQQRQRLESDMDQLRQERSERQPQHTELIGLVAELEKQMTLATAEQDSLGRQQQRLNQRLQQLDKQCADLKAEQESVESGIEQLSRDAADKDTALASTKQQLADNQQSASELRGRNSQMESQIAAAIQRRDMIQELERKQEGIQAGPRELLNLAQQAAAQDEQHPDGLANHFREVVGIVADLVQVHVQHASLIDIALGQVSQYVVVNGPHLLAAIHAGRIDFAGRVGLMDLRHPLALGGRNQENLQGVAGVIGRVDGLVQTRPEYRQFVETLLSNTWLVKSLTEAVHLRQTRDSRARFVTLDGEVLEPDGTLIVGPKDTALGLVSRRSELRELQRQLEADQQQLQDWQQQLKETETRSTQLQQTVDQLLNEHSEVSGQLLQQRTRAEAISNSLATANADREQALSETRETEARLETLASSLRSDQQHLLDNQRQIESLAAELDRIETTLQTRAHSHQELDQQLTVAKIQLAKQEQQLADLNGNIQVLGSQRAELEHTVAQSRHELAGILWGQRRTHRRRAELKTELESLATDKRQRQTAATAAQQQLAQLESAQSEFRQQVAPLQKQLETARNDLHQIQLEQEKLNLQSAQLRQRLREDYEIDVADLELQELTENEQEQREQIENEIKELRSQLSAIGSVNMDALNELEETEARYNELHGQYTDLVQARDELDKIVQRINNDSRRLFAETLEAIRGNFQKLFRETFGGGRADIVLEEGVDVLEAGIEIVATPPGKPQFNNSLLSGGEKALTAVSLLMAIFKFRPSPFCVLDEVDAPFDEANIGRFVKVLESFLSWTKFVIVTHSKKTMTAATTLYGVTMQESGVSKRVSVRFEEVNEQGEIADSAVERTDREEGSAA